MKTRDDADLFRDVPREDGRAPYGGHDRDVDRSGLAEGFAADDRHPSNPVDTSELEFLPGQEFTRRDGSRSR